MKKNLDFVIAYTSNHVSVNNLIRTNVFQNDRNKRKMWITDHLNSGLRLMLEG